MTNNPDPVALAREALARMSKAKLHPLTGLESEVWLLAQAVLDQDAELKRVATLVSETESALLPVLAIVRSEITKMIGIISRQEETLEREDANRRVWLATHDQLTARIEELEAALREAFCWMLRGDGNTPAQRGARCETSTEADDIVCAVLGGKK